MHHARKGVITPEMEFVALRESMLLEQLLEDPSQASRLRQHPGQPFAEQLPKQVTPEFVRSEVAAGRAIIPANVNHPELEPMIIGNFKVKIDPVRMASAFGEAIKGGRNAFLAGPMIVQEKAVSSTPEMGRPSTPESLQSAGPQGRAIAPV